MYECIVIGAGIEGSATAYNLAKGGTKGVLLLEQYEACHNRGSSCGQSRITRRAYETLFYVEMMTDAYKMWSDLEKEAGTTLYKRTGVMVFGGNGDPYVQQTIKSMKIANIPHDVLSGAEINRRFPKQMKIPDDYMCVIEEDAGILYAQKALRAMQEQFQKMGGTLLDRHEVTEIVPGDIVTVVTNRGLFKANYVVIAAGPWAPALCSSIGVHLPFKVSRIEVGYWRVEDPTLFDSSTFPTFLYADGEGHFRYYGLPIEEYPGLLKVCAHFGPNVDPDNRDAVGGPVTSSMTSKFINGTFRGVQKKPSITEFCMYTVSPDDAPVIDKHPQHDNIIIAAGFSGHGFKLSPVFGKLLSQLVMKKTPSHDLHPFRLSRFLSTFISKL